MDRRTFTRLTAASLLAAPSVLSAQSPRRVTVIGAGSAGMAAAYHLTKAGVDVEVLEASPVWGGRMKRLSGFADVPLDLGAEWIHDEPEILGQIISQDDTDLGVKTITYQPQTYQFWDEGTLKDFNVLRHAYAEVKFFDTTWYGFFERFLLPTVADKITYNAPVSAIARDGQGVRLTLADGRTKDTDAVIITAPISVLQRGQLTLSDDLRPPEFDALEDVQFGTGFKVFMKFKDRFYPDLLHDGPRSIVLEDTWASKLYYDAAFGKPTTDNILGLFTVSDGPLARASMGDDALLADVLAELTQIYGSQVKDGFLGGVVQNWTQEPFIQGSYSMDNNSDFDIEDILSPVAGRVVFAGEALGGDAQSTVHGAAFSAIEAAERILAG